VDVQEMTRTPSTARHFLAMFLRTYKGSDFTRKQRGGH